MLSKIHRKASREKAKGDEAKSGKGSSSRLGEASSSKLASSAKWLLTRSQKSSKSNVTVVEPGGAQAPATTHEE